MMQKVRQNTAAVGVLSAFLVTDSGSFHQSTTFFSTFPHGTFHYRSSVSYLALEEGSPFFEY